MNLLPEIVKASRNRVVTFRLTEEEYMRLKSACGADERSMSAAVRRTMLAWAEVPAAKVDIMEQRFGNISDRLHALEDILTKGE